jgi:hypothetical protein
VERDQESLRRVYEHIRRIKCADYPVMVGTPGNYRIEERPWKEMAEPSKLAILEWAVDWGGVSNRDQAHILLAEIDLGKITDSQRNRLIGMATEPTPGNSIDRKPEAATWPGRELGRGR